MRINSAIKWRIYSRAALSGGAREATDHAHRSMGGVSAVFRDRKVLVIGGLGFIGSTVVRRLALAGARVTVLDALAPECGGNLANLVGVEARVELFREAVGCATDLRPLLAGVDYLFNLAGRSGHLDSLREPEADLESNCRAQLAILEACRAENPEVRVVFTSTRQIYGRPRYLPVDEAHPQVPVDINGVHKVAGEAYHRLYHQLYGLRTTVLRLTNTYGPRMRIRDARQNFMGVWIRRLMEHEPFEVWDGSQIRDFTFAEDAADALLHAALSPEAEGAAFNVGGERASLRELAELLTRLCPGRYRVRPFPPERKAIDIGDYYADDRRFRAAAGWEPRFSLQAGLMETLAYYSERWREYV